MTQKKIGVLVGSLRKDSYSRKLAQAITELSPAGLSFEFIETGHLPFYNEDLEASAPQAWVEFRQKVLACDGLLFVMPEYNRGVPGVLKNAIDVGSRPYGKSVWNGKPSTVVSISQGPLAGFGAHHALRQSLVTLNAPCMAQPEAYIGNVAKVFDGEGKLVDSTREFFSKFAVAFEHWVNLLAR